MTKSFSEASVLVVGGAGFVGSNLVRRLVTENAAKVIVVDNFLSSEPENLPADPCVSVREGSICDDQMLRDIHDDYDYMFHLATYHGNQSSIHDPLADHQNNLLPSLKLFHHLVGFRRLKKVVYAGAGCAVAEKTFGPTQATRESDPIGFEMDSPYSISKLVENSMRSTSTGRTGFLPFEPVFRMCTDPARFWVRGSGGEPLRLCGGM